jgi:membrane-associated phospholipid phosphatase
MMQNRWKTYLIWAFWVGVAFFAVYPACNWITSQRDYSLDLHWEAELQIPFIPEFIWGYLSMYILFLLPPFFLSARQLLALGRSLILATLVSGVMFLLFPSKLGFDRIIPDTPFYAFIYNKLFSIDLPHNMVPSLHVVYSTVITFSIANTSKSIAFRSCCFAWLLLLCLSTLFVHQHHLLDVVSGLVLALITQRYAAGEEPLCLNIFRL